MNTRRLGGVVLAATTWVTCDGRPDDAPDRELVRQAIAESETRAEDTPTRARLALRSVSSAGSGIETLDVQPLAGSRPLDAQIERLLDDETFAARVWKMLRGYADGKFQMEIWQGQPTSRFPSCVAVGCDEHWHCSGVLIGRNAVLTAAHCFCPDGNTECSATRVAFGSTVDSPDLVVDVLGDPMPFRPCPGFATKKHDVCVLILEQDVWDFEPARLAGTKRIDAAQRMRIVGFGLDEFNDHGTKRKALINIDSTRCVGDEPEKYDCVADYEMVAGGPLLRDTCKGDSGGPGYTEHDPGLIYAITSRPIEGIDQCGNGGIYVRVDKYAEWLRGIPEITWP